MTHRFTSLLVALTVLTAPQFVRPAEPVVPEAYTWLDRVVAELPGIRQEDLRDEGKTNTINGLASEQVLAQMVVVCRRSDADRAWCLEWARRVEKTPPHYDTPLGRSEPLMGAANFYALAGDKEQTRRLLQAVEKLAVGLNDFDGMFVSLMRLEVREQIGDLTEAELEQMGTGNLMLLRGVADIEGREADVARYTALARKDAAALAAGTTPRSPYNGTLAFTKIARARHLGGDIVGAEQDLRDAFNVAQAANDDQDSEGCMINVLYVAIDLGDKVMIGKAADALTAVLNRVQGSKQRTPVYYYTELARAHTSTARRPEFERAVAAAQEAISLTSAGDQPAQWIKVAAAYARAGDKAKLEAAIARSEALGPLRSYEMSEYEQLAVAHAEAGDFKSALDVVRLRLPEPGPDRKSALCGIAARQSHAGLYTDAEQTVSTMTDPYRKLLVHRRIVIDRMKAKQTTGLAEWIAAHASARERAFLYLAVAQQMLGKDGKGGTIGYQILQ